MLTVREQCDHHRIERLNDELSSFYSMRLVQFSSYVCLCLHWSMCSLKMSKSSNRNVFLMVIDVDCFRWESSSMPKNLWFLLFDSKHWCALYYLLIFDRLFPMTKKNLFFLSCNKLVNRLIDHWILIKVRLWKVDNMKNETIWWKISLSITVVRLISMNGVLKLIFVLFDNIL